MKAPTTVDLVWTRDLIFEGRSGEASAVLDSAGKAGPSPVQALALSLAACMGMDVVHILTKGRHTLRGLSMSLVAERAQDNPHRVTAVTVQFTVTGAIPPDQIQRAIDLSHELLLGVAFDAQDIPFSSTFTVAE